MGFAKDSLDDTYSSPPYRFACLDCCCEPGLCEFISKHGEVGSCSYCCASEIVVCPLEFLVRHIDESLRLEYSEICRDNCPWDPEEREYLFQGHSTDELFHETGLDSCDPSFLKDVASCLNTKYWCDREGLYQKPAEEHEDEWIKFVSIVKYKHRFISLNQGLEEPEESDSLRTVEDVLSGIAAMHEELMPFINLKRGETLY